MPTIACSTRAVASSDYNAVALAARHYLTAGEATETIHDTKCKLPSGVDILASSTVTLVLHGSVGRQKILPSDLSKSELLRCFHEFIDTASIFFSYLYAH